MTKAKFNASKAYAPKEEEGTAFFDDGREIELLHFVYSHPDIESIRGSPANVLNAIDEYGRTKKYLMNVGEDKGKIVCDLIADVKPQVMVELGGYIGYSCILFGDAIRRAGGQRYYSLEMNPEFAAVIMSLVDLAGLSDIVKVVVGKSDASIARLYHEGLLQHIDLMFLDHYKPAYATDVKLCEELGLITPGSVLAADNVIYPGNPPYLEYVRKSVEEKRKSAGETRRLESLPDRTLNQYKERYGEMRFSQSAGNPDLVYESKLVHSFEPTGEPNILIILLSIAFIPVSATITIVSLLITYFSGTYYELPRPGPECKTILVTGVSMTKGLTIARMLARFHPHRIIAADTEPVPFISPGRYSRAVTKFYRLEAPGAVGATRYIDTLLDVIRQEKVDLWISCSSVEGAVEDGEVAKRAREEIGSAFEAVQFDSEVVEKLHEKDAFMEYIQSLGLPIPESHRCTSAKEVEDILGSSTNLNDNEKIEAGKRFILKPIGVDDKARSQMMTLLPLPEGREATSSYLSTLTISPENPYILQQYIKGSEYCTHSLVVHGEVKAFVACPSSDMLMQYEALPADSALSMKMLDFTKRVADDGGPDFTGHLSFDFLISGEGNAAHLYPIECNPRAHTAVVLFAENPVMADTYITVVDPDFEKKWPGRPPSVAIPYNYVQGYYWIGHDFVVRYLLFLMMLPSFPGHYSEVLKGPDVFWDHLWQWKDATWVVWDPVPFFVLYHVYWPMRFLGALLSGREWSRVNVSTGKMFGAK
ncbi:hypothetical protein BJX66DRAFT_351182 [Aspergillus keveii]|uniref:catechol O-methyltransferase n=1 Tax=Aspergillus keveii TaxID=714993 RepID=A0ABR4G7D7_9EURO